jgi:hypothetical protein
MHGLKAQLRPMIRKRTVAPNEGQPAGESPRGLITLAGRACPSTRPTERPTASMIAYCKCTNVTRHVLALVGGPTGALLFPKRLTVFPLSLAANRSA